jgi:hypothetical protein
MPRAFAGIVRGWASLYSVQQELLRCSRGAVLSYIHTPCHRCRFAGTLFGRQRRRFCLCRRIANTVPSPQGASAKSSCHLSGRAIHLRIVGRIGRWTSASYERKLSQLWSLDEKQPRLSLFSSLLPSYFARTVHRYEVSGSTPSLTGSYIPSKPLLRSWARRIACTFV